MHSRIIFRLLFSTICVVTLFIIFFYQLGNTQLQSYDEAWYAEITRNIIMHKQPFFLHFNNATFIDHPPMGFWMMSIPVLFLGSNEYSARFVPAFLGVLTIILIFQIGKNMGNAFVGFSAASILLSFLWFLYRARSGNLDIPFLFFETLTVFFLYKMNNNEKFLLAASGSFAALFLTKTMIGIGMLPLFVFMIYLEKKNIRRKTILLSCLMWIGIVFPWYVVNFAHQPEKLAYHFFQIGTRSQQNNINFDALKHTLLYLQIGIGRWFKPLFLALGLLIVLFIREKSVRKNIAILFLLLTSFLMPFLFSSKTEVWHLIPAFLPIALLLSYSTYAFCNIYFNNNRYLPAITTCLIFSLSCTQFKQSANLLYIKQSNESEKEISQKARKYEKIYLLDSFYPAAVYYAQKPVVFLYTEKDAKQQLFQKLQTEPNSVFILPLSEQEKLSQEQPFTVLETTASHMIIGSAR